MNSEQLAVLSTELKKIGYYQDLKAQRYEKIADKLNATATVPNPDPQGDVPKQFTWDTFLVLLSGAEIWGIYAQGNFAADLRSALESNSIVERNQLWKALKTALPAATATAVEAEFAKTIPDPTWQAEIVQPSIASVLGLPRVTPSDVQTVEQGL